MMTNVEKVRIFVKHAHNTPFTADQIAAGTGLTVKQVKNAMYDVHTAGLSKRKDGRYQVKGRTVK